MGGAKGSLPHRSGAWEARKRYVGGGVHESGTWEVGPGPGSHSVPEALGRASGAPARAEELVDCEEKAQEVTRRSVGHWARR